MATSTKPIDFLTCTIHSPGRGRALSMTRYGKPRPRASAANITKPMSGLPMLATSVMSETTTGPTQGAATMPTRRPIVIAPASPARPIARFARGVKAVGFCVAPAILPALFDEEPAGRIAGATLNPAVTLFGGRHTLSLHD